MKVLVVFTLLIAGTAQASSVCFIKAYNMSARAHVHLVCSDRPVQKIVDGESPSKVNLLQKKAQVISNLVKRGYRVESENMLIKY